MNLFILSTISIWEKSEKDLKREWEINNVIFGDKKKTSYEDYLKFLESWNKKKFSYSSEDNCYFTDLEKAKEYALSNVADINDGGNYNYVSIIEVPFNQAYAMTEIENIYIFKYVCGESRYEEVQLGTNEETKLILERNCCRHLIKSN